MNKSLTYDPLRAFELSDGYEEIHPTIVRQDPNAL